MERARATGDELRRRREERLRRVLRVVFAASIAGVLSTLPALALEGPPRRIGLANLALLCVLSSCYGGVELVVASGATELARRLLFATWVAYPVAELLLVPFGAHVAGADTLMASVATAFCAVVVVGVVALEPNARAARRWIAAELAGFVVASTLAGFAAYSGETRLAWFTQTGIVFLLLGCVGAFALVFATDLYQAVAAADQASLAKSRFLANMSHELRTPLTAILGYVELVREETTDPQAERDLDRVWLAATHLHSVIGDVLDLAKIEADKLELELASVELGPLIDQVQATAEPLAARNRNRLVVRRPELGAVRADAARLRQVLLNLLGNAAKFTEHGVVTLDIAHRGDRVAFVVSDTGIGVPLDKREQVFRPFEQADGSTTRRFGGTGLGLAISRALVERMGGALELDSEPDKGFRRVLRRGPRTSLLVLNGEVEYPTETR